MANPTTEYREALLTNLADPVEAKHYLNAVLEDYPEGFPKALRNVAQARQMAKVAQDAGIKRESLYRSLSDEGNPTFATLTSVLDVLGLKLTIAVRPKTKRRSSPSSPGESASTAPASDARMSTLTHK